MFLYFFNLHIDIANITYHHRKLKDRLLRPKLQASLLIKINSSPIMVDLKIKEESDKVEIQFISTEHEAKINFIE